MRMMHESRLWVVHLMIKVLRIRLLEVLVVHLRHRVEETVVIVVVVVLLLLLINRPARRRRLRRRRRRMEAQLLHIFVFFLCGVSPEKTKPTFESVEAERQRGIQRLVILFLVVLPFFQRITKLSSLKSGRKNEKKKKIFIEKRGEE